MRRRWQGSRRFGLGDRRSAGAADPGVTDKQITIGYILSGHGCRGVGVQDRRQDLRRPREAPKRGGRRERPQDQGDRVDDQSSGANLTATKDLIQNRGAFMVVNNSSFAFLSYRTMLDNKVPMVGGGYDGDYYNKPGAESLFSALGVPFTGSPTTPPPAS